MVWACVRVSFTRSVGLSRADDLYPNGNTVDSAMEVMWHVPIQDFQLVLFLRIFSLQQKFLRQTPQLEHSVHLPTFNPIRDQTVKREGGSPQKTYITHIHLFKLLNNAVAKNQF